MRGERCGFAKASCLLQQVMGKEFQRGHEWNKTPDQGGPVGQNREWGVKSRRPKTTEEVPDRDGLKPPSEEKVGSPTSTKKAPSTPLGMGEAGMGEFSTKGEIKKGGQRDTHSKAIGRLRVGKPLKKKS